MVPKVHGHLPVCLRVPVQFRGFRCVGQIPDDTTPQKIIPAKNPSIFKIPHPPGITKKISLICPHLSLSLSPETRTSGSSARLPDTSLRSSRALKFPNGRPSKTGSRMYRVLGRPTTNQPTSLVVRSLIRERVERTHEWWPLRCLLSLFLVRAEPSPVPFFKQT